MPNPNPTGPRVPLEATAVLPTTSMNVQVNHYRNPNCKDYGVPAQTKHQKPGPNPDRDRAYKRKGTNKGLVPAIQCHACSESPPLRSNASTAAEIQRLIGEDRLRTLEEQTVCLNTVCVNHALCVAQHRHAYRKYGFSETGERRYRCKACGSTPPCVRPREAAREEPEICSGCVLQDRQQIPCTRRRPGRTVELQFRLLPGLRFHPQALPGSFRRRRPCPHRWTDAPTQGH